MKQLNEAKWKFYVRDIKLKSTEKKIESFRELRPGWHYGEGVAPNEITVRNATRLNRLAHALGFPKTDAFPGVDGDVILVIYHENYDLEFTLRASGGITYYKMKEDEDIEYEKGLSFEQASIKVFLFNVEIWKLSDYLTSEDTATNPRNGQVRNLKAQGEILGIWSASGNAFLPQLVISAGT
jgi:hypothetical protein